MKLLLFSDVHTDLRAAARIVARAAEADVLVGAGDFAQARQRLEETISVLRAIEIPVVLVPGNSESYEELAAACADWPAARVLHGSGTTIQGVEFWGLGGGVPVTPFGAWSYDFTEEEAQAMLADCPRGAVLVSHSPPHGVLDQDAQGRHLGSHAVTEAIERARPALVVCGHIHASSGRQESLAEIPVVNAGPDGKMLPLEH